jgi:signal transduction histidine kinase
MLEILLANIVGNAFTHCAGGLIRFSVDDGALTVVNNGDLADGLAGRLFTPGAKGPASSGHGLGLSIAQALALRAGYCLEIVSRNGTVTTTLKKQ